MSFGRKGVVDSIPPEVLNRSSLVAEQGRMAPTLKYDVTLHPFAMLLGIIGGLAGAMVFVKKLQDPRGLLINRVIELDPASADMFWGALIVASLGLAVAAAIGFVRSFGERVYVTIDSHAISGPTSEYGMRTVRIEYRAIQYIKVTAMRDMETLAITAADGRKIKVGQWRFRISDQWGDFQHELRSKLSR